MLVLIEGPDGAGKTTFANMLATIISAQTSDPVTIMHRGPPRYHPLNEYEAPLLSYRPGLGRHIICDRWHWGERVYPRLFGRTTEMTLGMWLHIEMLLRSRGAIVVHLTQPTSILERRLQERGDDLVAPESASLLRQLFYAVEELTLMRFIHVDGFVEGEDMANVRLLERVVAAARNEELLCQKLNPFVTYVGPPLPDVVLLGSVRGGEPSAAAHGLRPAFMPFAYSSGAYLFDVLTRYVPRGDIPALGVANACDVDNVDTMLHVLGNPGVVTLGNVARARLGDDPVTIHHPQYRRRFLTGWRREYGAIIEEALNEARKRSTPPGEFDAL